MRAITNGKHRMMAKPLGLLIVFSLLSFAFSLTSCEGEAPVSGLTVEDRIMNAWNPTTNTNTDSGTYSSGLAYFVNDEGTEVAVSKGECSATNVVVPATYNTIPVVGVKEEGFMNSSSITTVSLPSSITMIGSAAFKSTGLTSFAVPYSMNVINPMAFMNCASLTSVTFSATAENGNQITQIGDYAFAGCSRLSIFELPSRCGIIGEAAFQGDYALTYMMFPKKCPDPSNNTKTIINIGQYAFADCSYLNYLFFAGADTINVGDFAFKNCQESAKGEFEGALPSALSSTTNWKYLQNSKYISISANVGSIYYNSGFFFHPDTHNYANKPEGYGDDVYIQRYNGSSSSDTAGSVTISIPPIYTDPDGIKHRIVGVGEKVFYGHYELGALTFTNLYDTDGDGEMEEVDNNVRYLESTAFFATTNLATIDLLNARNLLTVGSSCFQNNSACTSIVFPRTLQRIYSYGFMNFSKLESIRFDGTNAEDPTQDTASLIEIGYEAFQFANQNGPRGNCVIVFPKTLQALSSDNGCAAFAWCHWISGVIFTEPTDTTTKLRIGKYAFSRAYFIRNITFSSNIEYFGDMAFEFLSGDNNNLAPYGTHNSGMDWPIASLHSVFLPSTISTGGSLFQSTVRTTIYSDAESKPSTFSGTFNTCNGAFYGGYGDKTYYVDSNISSPVYYGVNGTIVETDGGGTITNGATMSTTLKNHIRYINSDYGDFDFVQNDLNGNTLTLTRFNYDGNDSESTAAATTSTPKIPASFSIGGTTYNVTAIGDLAFYNSYYTSSSTTLGTTGGITKVTIPNSVTSIGAKAFARCSLLSEVDSYTGNTVTANTLPSSLTKLANHAFGWCALTTIKINSALGANGYGYYNKSGNPFIGNISLADITVSGSSNYSAANGLVYASKDGNSYYYIVGAATAASLSLTLKSEVVSIADQAFMSATGITSLKTGTGLKEINQQSFQNCTKLASVDFTKSKALEKLGVLSFAYDTALTSVNGKGCTALTTIGARAFQNDNALLMADFSSCTALTTIDSYAFMNDNSMTSIDLSGCTALTAINQQAFQNTNKLTGIDLSAATNLTTIGTTCFQNSMNNGSLNGTTVKVTLPNGALTTLGDQAFSSCYYMTDLDVGSLTSSGTNAFINCSRLANINWRNIQTINDNAFKNCAAIASLSLPSTCTSVGNNAFNGCTTLSKVSWAGDSSSSNNPAVTIASDAFSVSSSGALASIVVPKGSTVQSGAFSNQAIARQSSSSTTSAIFLKDTGTEYDAANTAGRYPAGWNAILTDTTQSDRIAKYAVYCPDGSTDRTTATDAKYWHYVGGVPTIYTPS